MSAVSLDKAAATEAFAHRAGKGQATYMVSGDSAFRRKLAMGVTALVAGAIGLASVGPAIGTVKEGLHAHFKNTEVTAQHEHHVANYKPAQVAATLAKSEAFHNTLDAKVAAIPKFEAIGDHAQDSFQIEQMREAVEAIRQDMIDVHVEIKAADKALSDHINDLHNQARESTMVQTEGASFNSEAEVVDAGALLREAAEAQQQLELVTQAGRDLTSITIGINDYTFALNNLQNSMDPDVLLDKYPKLEDVKESPQEWMTVQSEIALKNFETLSTYSPLAGRLADRMGVDFARDVTQHHKDGMYPSELSNMFTKIYSTLQGG